MATNKRKLDEKHLKILREVVALTHNKQCFDCHQRGPTYVNMTIGSYVCTSCSGILRGLNPPHRVKSISMASFTQDEMELLKSRGNDLCRKVYLGMYDSRTHSEPNSKDEHKVREFMIQKYEKKRWFVTPTETMYEEARKMNTPTVEKKETKPLKTLVGKGVPKLNVSTTAYVSSSAAVVTQSAPVSTSSSSMPASVNLLEDLGGDPFASAPAPQKSVTADGFADFSAFNTQPVQPIANRNIAPTQQPVSFPPAAAGGLLQPVNSSHSESDGRNLFDAISSPANTQQTKPPTDGGDRYAALADVFGGSQQTATSSVPSHTNSNMAVNWAGGSGGVGWDQGPGGMTSNVGAMGAGTHPGLSTNSSLNTNSSFMNPLSSSQQVPSSTNMGSGFATGVNPFREVGAGPPRQPVANPFFGGNPSSGTSAFSQAGMAGPFGHQPVPSDGTFGGGQVPSGAAGTMGAKNGVWGMQGHQLSESNSMFPGAMPQGVEAQKPSMGGFGGVPQTWGQQQAGNPFMGGAGSQHGVPPGNNAKNPFL